jgi:hypothetical protein
LSAHKARHILIDGGHTSSGTVLLRVSRTADKRLRAPTANRRQAYFDCWKKVNDLAYKSRHMGYVGDDLRQPIRLLEPRGWPELGAK